MVRAWLRDDVTPPGVTRPDRATRLDDECCSPQTAVDVLPSLTIRQRERVGYSMDGDPIYEWHTIVEGRATLWEKRTEDSDIAGRVSIVAKATVLYDGDEVVTEQSLVRTDRDENYGVTAITQHHGSLELELLRRV